MVVFGWKRVENKVCFQQLLPDRSVLLSENVQLPGKEKLEQVSVALIGEKHVPRVIIATSHTILVKRVLSCTLTSKFGDDEDATEVFTEGPHQTEVRAEALEEGFLLMLIMQYQIMSFFLHQG